MARRNEAGMVRKLDGIALDSLDLVRVEPIGTGQPCQTRPFERLELVERRQLDAMVRMLPRRRDEGSRKGRSREVVARSLAISALSASLSEHAAARMVIGWGSDLGDLRDVVGVALRGPSDAVERALIEDAEAHVLQAQRECLDGLGLLRLSDVPIAS